MMKEEPIFHLFGKLPPELRDEIWRWCLPHRVCELNLPVASNRTRDYYSDGPEPVPCKLLDTTQKNSRPPLIWGVCHDSRAVALETGDFVLFDYPKDTQWDRRPTCETFHGLPTLRDGYWADRSRDIAHVNWTHDHRKQNKPYAEVLQHAARDASKLCGIGSVSLYFVERSWFVFDGESVRDHVHDGSPLVWMGDRTLSLKDASKRDTNRRDLEALTKLRKWYIIMRTIVVHADIRTAAASGLFGLLGDARVQIVDIADTSTIEALMNMAKRCEPFTVTVKQDFNISTTKLEERLQWHITGLGFRDRGAAIRPAIMFRLCTQMCNHFNQCMVPAPFEVARRVAIGRGKGGRARMRWNNMLEVEPSMKQHRCSGRDNDWWQ